MFNMFTSRWKKISYCMENDGGEMRPIFMFCSGHFSFQLWILDVHTYRNFDHIIKAGLNFATSLIAMAPKDVIL